MKNITLSILCFFIALSATSAQLVISEIMYNPPEGGTDSLEFIEIHNPTASPINVDQYVLSFSIAKDTLSGSIPAGGFYVSAVRASAFETAYGMAPSSVWNTSGLSNGGTTINLEDANGTAVTTVSYDDAAPWPTSPDGNGSSLEICNLASPDNGMSWQASTTNTGFSVDGTEVLASPFSLPACAGGPGPASYPMRTIGELITVDAIGTLDSIGATATLEATVNSVDFNGGTGLEFFMQDQSGGIRIISSQNIYTVSIGDLVSIRGTIEQRNGSAQFSTDSIRVLPTTSQVIPKVVTDITEADQGELVTLQNFSLVNADDWSTNSSFNIEITNGTVVVLMRVDENTDFAGMNEPTGTFDVTGIANQFDSSSPYDEGYQIQPRFTADISPYNPGAGPSYPMRAIDDINNVDATSGVADSLTKRVTVEGTVLGFNLRAGGLQFTIVDQDGNGIGVFNLRDDLGYMVTQGDLISVRGQVDQFNGLTQIAAEEISFVRGGNSYRAREEVLELDEYSESRLVVLEDLSIVDVNEWRDDPAASFNVRFTNANRDTFSIRIVGGSGIVEVVTSSEIAGIVLDIIGIGGQFDRDAPYFDDYQLFPRNYEDLGFFVDNVSEVDLGELFSVLPQGDGWQLDVKQVIKQLELRDIQGRVVSRLSNVQPGTVFLNKPVASSYVLTAITAENKRGSVVLVR
ncbi:MAG: lamin tail domain-containing protein [Saprospiraceae bacterium]